VKELEFGEGDLLGIAVEDQAAVAALADARVLCPRRDPGRAGKQLALCGDDPPAGVKPLVYARLGAHRRHSRYGR
jgi:hypothetical protein